MPQRITAEALKELLISKPSSVVVIDVRDADHYGGHIANSAHFPSRTFSTDLPKVLEATQHAEKVVFHCSLS